MGDGGEGGGLLRRFIQTKAKETNPNFSSGENMFKKLLSFIKKTAIIKESTDNLKNLHPLH